MANVLVLGGVGFIGRNLVTYLVENGLAGKIRVADKVMPQTAYLTERQQAAFKQVEYVQGNLARAASVAKAFDGDWEFVINCAGMTKYGQEPIIYKENVFELSTLCAKEAAKKGVKMFIEMSTGQVYAGDKKPSSESGKTKPWTLIAEQKLLVEAALADIAGLNYIIIRPAIVYGVSDVLGLMPRLVMGAIYKRLGETMKVLWSEKLRLNTVHVDDVVAAIWHLCQKGEKGKIYNVADKSDSTQETVCALISEMFGIKHGYAGTIMSNLAKLNMKGVTEEVNEKHMQPWMEMCRDAGVENSPITPYLDQELLYNNSTSIDGSFIESTGFKYTVPNITLEKLRESADEYMKMNLFPKGYFA